MLGDRRSNTHGARPRSAARTGAIVLAAAVALVAAPLTTARAAVVPEGASPDELIPAVLDMSAAVNNTTMVAPESLPPATEIGPGSHLLIERSDGLFGCTANFVWTSGSTTYLGAAGHCFLTADEVATHGAEADTNASDVEVSVCVSGCYFGGQVGFIIQGTTVRLGNVAFARQSLGAEVRGYDFGVVAVPTALLSRVRPSMPVWGGPTTATTPSMIIGPVCHYGYGVVFGEAFPTQARVGSGFAKNDKFWTGYLASAFGDSGSAVVVCAPGVDGLRGVGALGLITHLGGSTTITTGTTVPQAIALASAAGLSLSLVTA